MEMHSHTFGNKARLPKQSFRSSTEQNKSTPKKKKKIVQDNPVYNLWSFYASQGNTTNPCPHLFKPDAIPLKRKRAEPGMGSVCCRWPWGRCLIIHVCPLGIALSTERGQLCCSVATGCRRQQQAHRSQNFGTNIQTHTGHEPFKAVGAFPSSFTGFRQNWAEWEDK